MGIASNARAFNLREAAPLVIYLSYLQYPQWAQFGDLLVRTNQPPETLTRAISREIESLGHEYVFRSQTASEVVSQELAEEHATAVLAGFFAILALLLASVGLYGLTSYSVARRTREIGIRVAVGAERQNVLWIVLRETLTLVVVGIVIGVPCGLATSRLIASLLFGLSSSDFSTIVGASLVILVVAMVAGYLPARKASMINPIVALRTE